MQEHNQLTPMRNCCNGTRNLADFAVGNLCQHLEVRTNGQGPDTSLKLTG